MIAMRLWPDSMAGRTMILLFAGLAVTVTGSLSVFQLDFFHGKGWGETFRNLHRIAVIATIVERVPAEQRPALLPALNDSRLTVAWEPHATPAALRQSGMTRHLARDIRVLAETRGLERVEAGYPAGTAAPRWFRPGPSEVWVGLSDRTWLRFVIGGEEIGGLWPLRLAVSAGLMLIGIAALGVWAARKVTAPLGRFALAAERLGANVDAPPLREQGPGEIRQAAKAFNGMQARIRRLIDDRTLMLAALSHDLRTALTRLRFRTEFITDPEQRSKADIDLDQMQAMLQSALTFARDDAASEPTTRIDLAMLLQSLCDDLQDAGKTISYAGPVHLNYQGRPVSLRRAFVNLLDNALAYGREVEVTLGESGEAVEITVCDRGPGIPAAMREQVFVPFFRLEASRNRETGGVGLGLTVARTVVRRHGGEIILDDRPGGGLLVHIQLPLAPKPSGFGPDWSAYGDCGPGPGNGCDQ
ncbi:ATP-binding protein [Methylococcus mesophilus]|uniref:ATP-binding protein n=1 Tax=Methylococcus mesophilus TaxID=2993564 RepID=UPI00224A6F90|nr:ATP-binding protein [Methylococcus mesophilus]UZR27783.1 ATP-binding protein [Methylococcus mesophilus]